MNLVERIVGGLELRSLPAPLTGSQGQGVLSPWGISSWLPPWAGVRGTRSMTTEASLEIVAVYGAVNLIASAIGSLPLEVFREGDKIEPAKGTRQWRMLHDRPNDEMAADELWESVEMALLLWGNAFVWKERDSAGLVQQLWPINPARVGVGRKLMPDGSSIRYFQIDGASTLAFETDVLHIRRMSADGLVGLSPVQQARQQLLSHSSQADFAEAFWENGTFFGGFLEHPNELSEAAQTRLATQISARKGTDKAGEWLVLEEAMKAAPNIAMPLGDAQFIEQMKLSDFRVAQMFRLVPPHRWASDQASITYSNAELSATEFVRWTCRPDLVRIEQSLLRDPSLFAAPGPRMYPKFRVDELLRSDKKSRWETYAIGYGKWIDALDIRDEEDLPTDDETMERIAETAASGVEQPAADPAANGKPAAPVPA